MIPKPVVLVHLVTDAQGQRKVVHQPARQLKHYPLRFESGGPGRFASPGHGGTDPETSGHAAVRAEQEMSRPGLLTEHLAQSFVGCDRIAARFERDRRLEQFDVGDVELRESDQDRFLDSGGFSGRTVHRDHFHRRGAH
jgi:hypothetical protein